MNILKKSTFLIIFAFLFGFFSEYAMEEKNFQNKKQKTSSEEQSKEIAPNLFSEIREAIKKGDVEWIKNFIELNKGKKGFLALINRAFDNNTFLLIALKQENFEIARLLIDNDLLTHETLNIQDENGDTPLVLAVDMNNPELAQLMIEKGANLDLQNNNGLTALMLAIIVNLHGVAELLIEKGANLDLQTNKGNTALIIAIARKQEEIAELLIKKGANLNLQDKRGITALNIAARTRQIEIATLIKEVMEYKNRISNGKDDADALYNAITQKNTEYNFSASEWLTLALIGKNEKQIDYCIKHELFTKEEVENQKLYLELRSKNSKELLKLVENRTYTPFDILRALSVQPEDIMPIDVNIAANLLEYTTPEERTSIMKLAQKYDNKKLGKKIIDFNNNIRLFTNKKNKPLPEELSKKIATYF